MKFIEYFKSLKNSLNINKKRTLKSTKVLNNGVIVTFAIGSVVSGIVDLVFFSGLSVSMYSLFGFISIPAGAVLCLMSLVITSAKAWSAMKADQVDELISVLKSLKYNCWQKLKKPKRAWKRIHNICMLVSIMTAMSLSVVSIGDGIRKNQNEIRKANEEITTLAELINANIIGQKEQRNIIYSSVNVGTNSTQKAQEQASKIWPIIVEYRNERAEFEATGIAFNSKNEINWKGQTITPDKYWDKKNSEVQSKVKVYRTLSLNTIRTITDETALAQEIKNEIEELNKNKSKNDLDLLDVQTKQAMATAVNNLQGRFYWPSSLGGELVVFDESNPSMALTTLKDLKAAYENDTGDVGESAKLFVLLGPAIENAFGAKLTLENVSEKSVSSSFGITEIMIMAAILFFGLLQELIIAALTPKITITRNVFFYYNLDEEVDIEEIMYYINRKYLSNGVISLEEFEEKTAESKIVQEISKTLSGYTKSDNKKRTKNKKEQKWQIGLEKGTAYSNKVDNLVKEIEELI